MVINSNDPVARAWLHELMRSVMRMCEARLTTSRDGAANAPGAMVATETHAVYGGSTTGDTFLTSFMLSTGFNPPNGLAGLCGDFTG